MALLATNPLDSFSKKNIEGHITHLLFDCDAALLNRKLSKATESHYHNFQIWSLIDDQHGVL